MKMLLYDIYYSNGQYDSSLPLPPPESDLISAQCSNGPKLTKDCVPQLIDRGIMRGIGMPTDQIDPANPERFRSVTGVLHHHKAGRHLLRLAQAIRGHRGESQDVVDILVAILQSRLKSMSAEDVDSKIKYTWIDRD
jgi:hypothetical protein